MFAFKKESVSATFRGPSGSPVLRTLEIRKNPITGTSSRITFSRSLETERGLERLHTPPQEDMNSDRCPFCQDAIATSTPMLSMDLDLPGRLMYHSSVLFPNLFPYTEWSGVAIMDDRHYVEIGTASVASYRDCLINCSQYLDRVAHHDRDARFMGITQNHLPAAGGSLIHPHFQVHATRHESNRHRLIRKLTSRHRQRYGSGMLSDFMDVEMKKAARYIGSTGSWEWAAAFAPDGFYELWAIAPGNCSLTGYQDTALWEDLAAGIVNAQRFYRSLNRNSYNLGLLSIENESNAPELLVSIKARSSYAPWVRSDITGFEMAFDEMATFSSPESTAEHARVFWNTTN